MQNRGGFSYINFVNEPNRNSVLRGGVVCTLTLVPKYVWTHARKLRIKGFIKGLKALLKLPLLRKKRYTAQYVFVSRCGL